MAFPLALALGIVGLREVLEVELTEPLRAEEVRRRLASEAPPGLDLIEAEEVGPGRATQVAAVSYALAVPADRAEACRAAVATFLASDRWPHQRQRPDRGRTRDVDLRRFVTDAGLAPDLMLRFRLTMSPEGSARPEEVVEALGLTVILTRGAVLVRTDVELASATAATPPIVFGTDPAVEAPSATAIVPKTTTAT
jgi:radical SAM-linked protein